MYYKFLNVNPLGKFEEDCVCRAIKSALNKDYYYIQNQLELIAQLFDCEKLCVCCYKFLLDNVYGLKRIEEYNGKPIKYFLNTNPHGTYIIRVDGHLTHCVDGVVYDLFDCTDDIIDIIWEASSLY